MEKKGGFHPLKSLCTAFSLYSRIPVPQSEVDVEGMRYALCFFPCIGVVTGIAMLIFREIASAISLGEIAFCCVGTAIPLIITGGIHMDGFLDVADALSSFAETEKKQEILRDPHTGAFALIAGGVYLLFYTAALSELDNRAFPAITGIYVITRALSGFSVVSFKKSEGSVMAKSLSDASDIFAVRLSTAVWIAVSMLFFLFTAGLAVMLIETTAAVICLAVCEGISKREFGGMNGDTAGFYLQVTELLLLIILALIF